MQYIETSTNNPELRRVYFHLVDATDGITPEAGEGGGRPTISINGRTPANAVNTLQAVDASKGDYYLELSTTEIVTPRHLLLHYKSANTAHFAQQVQVMAFDPYTQFGTLNGPSGPDVDYKRIKKLVDESVASISIPEQKEPDLVPISEGLQALLTEIRAIKLPDMPRTDLQPVQRQIEALERTVTAIKIPVTDLSETNKLIQSKNQVLDQLAEVQEEIKTFYLKDVRELFGNGIEKIKKGLEEMNKKFDNTPVVILKNEKPKQEPKPNVLEEYLKL